MTLRKPKFVLKDQSFIELKVRAYKSFDEKLREGVMIFTFEDITLKVGELDEEGFPELGNVAGGIGAIQLSDRRRKYGHDYLIPLKDLWYAFQEALEAGGKEHSAWKRGSVTANRKVSKC